MLKHFNDKGQQPIYDPNEFAIFCCEAGAPTLFENLQTAICTTRQSSERIETNRGIVVSIIYQLCFGLNQRCNSMQKDNMLFMITENMNKEAINTQRRLGLSCSSQTAYRHLRYVEQCYRNVIESAIKEAIEKKAFDSCKS